MIKLGKWDHNDYPGELTAFQQEVIEALAGSKAAKAKKKKAVKKAG